MRRVTLGMHKSENGTGYALGAAFRKKFSICAKVEA